MERKYILILWDKTSNKIIKEYRFINAKKITEILAKIDFKKKNCCYSCYKEMNSIDVFFDTVNYIK